MFLGQYEHSIDSKSRLTVPVRYRAALASGAYVLQGFERNLMVYTTETFEKLSRRAYSLSMTNPEVRAMWRLVFGRAHEVHLDSSGRILIPAFLMDYAEIVDTAAIVGTGEFFEIWNPEIWAKQLDSVTDPEINVDRFSIFDLSTE